MVIRTVVVVAAALALAAPAAAATIVVRPGDSLERARDAARRTPGADTVVLRGGTYLLAHTLELDARDSHVVWRAAAGETPVLSGGVPIGRWRVAPDGAWTADVGRLATRQLWVGGARATRARGTPPPLVRTPTGYATVDGSPLRLSNPRDVELVFDSVWRQYRGPVASVRGAALTMAQPFFANAQLDQWATIALPTWIENAPELLDRPGEWYLDRPSHVLTYLPRRGETPAHADAVASRLETLVRARGTLARPIHDLGFEGITFSHAGWLGASTGDGFAAVQANMRFVGRQQVYDVPGEYLRKMPAAVELRAAHRVTFVRDRFVHLGGAGVDIAYGSRDDALRGCELTDVSGNAIQLGDVSDHHPRDTREPTRRIAIVDDYIHDVAVEYQGGVGIWGGYVSDVVVAHDEISDLPYTGVSLGWGWGERDDPPTPAGRNRVEANYVHDVLRVLGDGGAIYLLGAQPGSVVRGNLVLHVGGFGGALYLDDGSRDTLVEGNAVWDTREWPFMFKGTGLTIRDNLWDYDMWWGYYKFGGLATNNRVIAGPDQIPALLATTAGLEPEYRWLTGR